MELEQDIKHCEEVLEKWTGCEECKCDHERLLSYMRELQEFRNKEKTITVKDILELFSENGKIESPLCVFDCDDGTGYIPLSPTDYSGTELENKKVKCCYYDDRLKTINIETTNQKTE